MNQLGKTIYTWKNGFKYLTQNISTRNLNILFPFTQELGLSLALFQQHNTSQLIRQCPNCERKSP